MNATDRNPGVTPADTPTHARDMDAGPVMPVFDALGLVRDVLGHEIARARDSGYPVHAENVGRALAAIEHRIAPVPERDAVPSGTADPEHDPGPDPSGMTIHEQLEALPDVAYDAAAKARFRDLAMRVQRDLAQRLGLAAGTYDLRWNEGGVAVSGEATLHGDHLYVRISQSCMSGGRAGVLWRACEGRKDYCGGRNRFCGLTDMQTLIRMKAVIEAGFDDPGRLIVAGLS